MVLHAALISLAIFFSLNYMKKYRKPNGNPDLIRLMKIFMKNEINSFRVSYI